MEVSKTPLVLQRDILKVHHAESANCSMGKKTRQDATGNQTHAFSHFCKLFKNLNYIRVTFQSHIALFEESANYATQII
jgi:hypothetical protein